MRVINPLGAFLEEAEHGIGSSYEATVWRKLEDGTRKAYAGALYKFLRYSRINGFMAPREALKGRMLHVARDGQYESPFKALLSGLRLAEKMAIIPTIVVPADWMFAESLERLRISRNPRDIRWAEGDIICRIAKTKDTWEWKELECLGLAVLSLTNLLRIGGARTVSSPGDGKLCFMGEKSQSGEHDQDLGPWPSRWMRFIKEERQKHGVAEDRPHGYQSPADLEEAWVALVAGSELEHYRWHCLRRGGATQLWASGARNQIVMLAGGWESPSVARHYTKPKHAWKFVERGEQPVPVCGDSRYHLVYGDWSSKQWWPAWLRKELRELAAEARTDGDVLGPTGQAARKRRHARSKRPPGAE